MPDPIRLYYNPACSKCRAALALLEQHGCRPELRHYLDQPPAPAELEALLDALDTPPEALLRPEPRAEATPGAPSREQVIAILGRDPDRLQRPILQVGDRAIIARPPELALRLLA